jgi:restriction endonuclease Mrr
MSDKQFEYFSAALVIALGEGHRFHSRVGGSGDDGVDTKLTNLYGNMVIVQSKLYQASNTVGPAYIRDFMGAIALKDAVYGYFVTTSKLTDQAARTAAASRRPIRVIDGSKIEAMLQYRSREIALAYKDVLDAIPKEE